MVPIEDLLAMKLTVRRADLLYVRSIKGWFVMSEINGGTEPKKLYFPIPEGFSEFTREEREAYANALFEFLMANHLNPKGRNVGGGN